MNKSQLIVKQQKKKLFLTKCIEQNMEFDINQEYISKWITKPDLKTTFNKMDVFNLAIGLQRQKNMKIKVPQFNHDEIQFDKIQVDDDDQSDSKFIDLINWLKITAKNFFFDKVEIFSIDKDYRGIRNLQPIKAKERVIQIPSTHFLSINFAKQMPLCQLIKQYYDLWSDHSYLSIMILEESIKKNSYWKSYIKTLPKYLKNFPVFFGQLELNMLQGSYILDNIAIQRELIKNDYELIIKIDPSFEQRHSFNSFAWARMIVHSRLFGVKMNGNQTSVMVPFADMINHDPNNHFTWKFDDQLQVFYFESHDDIPSLKHQLYISYGQKPNSVLLQNYGFVLENNDSENQVEIRVQQRKNDPLEQQKRQLDANYIYEQSFYLKMDIYHQNFQNLLGYLRYQEIKDQRHMKRVEVLYYKAKEDYDESKYFDSESESSSDSENKDNFETFSALRTDPITIENEEQIIKNLLQIIIWQLNQYPNSLQDDLKKIRTDQLSFEHKNILIFISGEKIILNFYKEFCETILEIIQMGENVKQYLQQKEIIDYIELMEIEDYDSINKESKSIQPQQKHQNYLDYIVNVILPLKQLSIK